MGDARVGGALALPHHDVVAALADVEQHPVPREARRVLLAKPAAIRRPPNGAALAFVARRALARPPRGRLIPSL